jgi:hypothetical protein
MVLTMGRACPTHESGGRRVDYKLGVAQEARSRVAGIQRFIAEKHERWRNMSTDDSKGAVCLTATEVRDKFDIQYGLAVVLDEGCDSKWDKKMAHATQLAA